MTLLVLMRHAKAVREHEAPRDEERALTGRGRADAVEAARALREAGHAVARIVASSATRTAETAHFVADHLQPPLGVHLDAALYLAAPETIWSHALGALPRGATLVIGHNPGLHALAAQLVAETAEHSAQSRAVMAGLPTSAWAAFDVTLEEGDPVGLRFLGGWRPKQNME